MHTNLVHLIHLCWICWLSFWMCLQSSIDAVYRPASMAYENFAWVIWMWKKEFTSFTFRAIMILILIFIIEWVNKQFSADAHTFYFTTQFLTVNDRLNVCVMICGSNWLYYYLILLSLFRFCLESVLEWHWKRL